MKLRSNFAVIFILAVSTLLVGLPLGATSGFQAQTAPDNSKENKRDRGAAATTADQQKSNSADTETTKQIRDSIMKDKSLSTYAHNIKIIAQDGKVTLKGPVRSEDEKKNVLTKATAVAGESNVTDQITIAAPKQ